MKNNLFSETPVAQAQNRFRNGRSESRPINSAGNVSIYQVPSSLPTLGLNKFKNVELKNETAIPVSIKKYTKKVM